MLLLLDSLAAYGSTHIELLPSTKPVAASVKDSVLDCKHGPDGLLTRLEATDVAASRRCERFHLCKA